MRPSVSPDGKSFAYLRYERQGAVDKLKFIVQKLSGEAGVQELDTPSDSNEIGWTPDGRALTYLHWDGHATHLYMRPLSGRPPVQLTHFDSEPAQVVAYAWSLDGKKIGITRQQAKDTDVVMFSGFR